MELLSVMEQINRVIVLVVTLLYAYQGVYCLLGFLRWSARDSRPSTRLRRYAALISARNEEGVIPELIASLKRQNYPTDLLDIYVVADNCTDDTAGAAERAGAKVYRRFDHAHVGKGYALDYLWHKLVEDELEPLYEGYFIFDADNIVHPNFVSEMNRTFDHGDFTAVTGYRNSKNFGENWITAGYSIWFLREARFVNSVRMMLGTNCHVSGTGFLISADFLRKKGGWNYHLLTEDLQFSAECAVEGNRIGYCDGAMIYDEQPTSFRQSWDQRLRWSKGFYQVDKAYGGKLLAGLLRGGRRGWGCYDILLTITPGVLLTLLAGVLQGAAALCCVLSSATVAKQILTLTFTFLWDTFRSFYGGFFLYGVLTVLSEWRKIHAPDWRKLVFLPLFPLFMLTYLPITVAALFQKVEWKPISHKSLAQLDRAV